MLWGWLSGAHMASQQIWCVAKFAVTACNTASLLLILSTFFSNGYFVPSPPFSLAFFVFIPVLL